jgi:hypothetical protein
MLSLVVATLLAVVIPLLAVATLSMVAAAAARSW